MKNKKNFKKKFSKVMAVILSAGMMMPLTAATGKAYADNPPETDGGYIAMEGGWDDGVPAAAEDVDLLDADVIHLEEEELPEDTVVQEVASGMLSFPSGDSEETSPVMVEEEALYGNGSDGTDESEGGGEPQAFVTEEEISGDSALTAWPFTASQAASDTSCSLLNRFPEIRDQEYYNTCWSFTAIGMMEMSMISQGKARTGVDYSELALAYSSYHIPSDPFGGLAGDGNGLTNGKDFLTGGGNMVIALPTLFTWAGAVSEKDVPYSTASGVQQSGLSESVQRKDQAHITELRLFNLQENPNAVKKWIRENGAASFTLYKPSDYQSYYNGAHNAYYCNTAFPANHAVDVVGWDDAFPAKAFANTHNRNGAPTNGAWLVRNSYGKNKYHFYGYFWISYADATIGDTVYGIRASEANNYENNYQYDGAGYSVNIDAVEAANIFKAQAGSSGEILRAVAVGVAGERKNAHSDYTVRIYRNLSNLSDPTSGQLCESATTSGDTDQSGVYTVKLANPVQLNKGEYYSVVVEVSGSRPKVMAESSYDRGELKITASMKQQQSFVKVRNSSEWVDLKGGWKSIYNYSDGGNLRIKAFTDKVAASNNPSNGSGQQSGSNTAVTPDPNKSEANQSNTTNSNPAKTTDKTPSGKSGDVDVSSVKDSVKMYRLYNRGNKEHFYTASAHERSVLVSLGWNYEGIGWYAPATGDPVYRLYNKYLRDHHYTMSRTEKDYLVSVGWNYEGVGWYSDPEREVPLYRQYNPYLTSGSHNYTTSSYEASVLISRGWIDEKIGWYGVKAER
uniref:lectin like domain-containing protein n=1 Tax=Eubacterium cellulosolvens TaxID=29322 RepID=UPI0009DE926B|nr:lectin like domain-containing protein [[Eubacterium] cellulosolvens]